MQWLNAIPRLVLRSRLHGLMSRRFALLAFSGRRTGRVYWVPVSYVQEGDCVLVGTEAAWVRNLRDGRPVTVWLRGRTRPARPEVVVDSVQLRRLFEFILARNPVLGRFLGIRLGPRGQFDAAMLERARRRGLAAIRLELRREDGVRGLSA